MKVVKVISTVTSSFWGFEPGQVVRLKPTKKKVYGKSTIRRLYDWPKYHEVTHHFVVKE